MTLPTLFRNFVTVVKNPYLSTTRRWMSSISGPVTIRAVPSSGDVCALTLPRPSHGCTSTRGVWARRLALPDAELVQNPKPPSSGTHHTGVATGVPSRLNVVRETYCSSAGSIPATYAAHCGGRGPLGRPTPRWGILVVDDRSCQARRPAGAAARRVRPRA